jgi:Zn-finger nucleic acid-binding protein
MDCVKCEGKLGRVEVDGVMVDQCGACAGIWFDGGELRRVLGMKSVAPLRTVARPSKADDDKPARCPRCRGQGYLVRVASLTSDIHIDTCPVCGGQWLDGGELAVLRDEGGFRPVLALLRRILSA